MVLFRLWKRYIILVVTALCIAGLAVNVSGETQRLSIKSHIENAVQEQSDEASVLFDRLGRKLQVDQEISDSSDDEDDIDFADKEDEMVEEDEMVDEDDEDIDTEDEEDLSLSSLKQRLSVGLASENENKQVENERMLSIIDEYAKQMCCKAAFELCVQPPWMSVLSFHRRRPTLLKQASRPCSKIPVIPKPLSRRRICSYFQSQPMNCAMTPNTADDIQRYEQQAAICCAQAPKVCANMDNPTIAYFGEQQCFYFAARTPQQVCDIKDTFPCKDVNTSIATGQGE